MNVDIAYAGERDNSGQLTLFQPNHIYSSLHANFNLINRVLFPIRLFKFLKHILKNNRYQTLIACDIASLQVLATIKSRSKKIYWAFELSGVKRKFGFSWDAIRAFRLGAYLSKMNVIIAPSKERVDILTSYAPNTKFIVIGNFRANRFQDISKLGNYNSHSDVIKMVFAGKISFGSDVHLIIQEIAKYANLTLTLVGIMDNEFEAWWNATSFKNVRYEGVIPNHHLIPFLQQFDIAVCTYAHAAVGIEAMHPAPTKAGDAIAAGCILLCSNQPYLLELVEKYKIGFVYSEATRSEVCQQVSRLTGAELSQFKHNVKVAFRHCSMDQGAAELIRCLN